MWLFFNLLCALVDGYEIYKRFTPAQPGQDSILFLLAEAAYLKYCQNTGLRIRDPGDAQLMALDALRAFQDAYSQMGLVPFVFVPAYFMSSACRVFLRSTDYPLRVWVHCSVAVVTLISFACAPAAVPHVVSSEKSALRMLPEEDPANVVGQWGAWAGFAFPLMAAAIMFAGARPTDSDIAVAGANSDPQERDSLVSNPGALSPSAVRGRPVGCVGRVCVSSHSCSDHGRRGSAYRLGHCRGWSQLGPTGARLPGEQPGRVESFGSSGMSFRCFRTTLKWKDGMLCLEQEVGKEGERTERRRWETREHRGDRQDRWA
ncbi:hypothetical protein CALCODRAFT_502661 [Calocera cornea HHB12733]|uniref:Uncharacterized protein n=1 Tax=Calocera cornea HHB12733 TaxID=1353952 RepID=A0A165D5T7_9BASI|nr:hypothetical protein CALCODRAFT_502661 [Calocera cornea HHB12733]